MKVSELKNRLEGFDGDLTAYILLKGDSNEYDVLDVRAGELEGEEEIEGEEIEENDEDETIEDVVFIMA